MNSQIINLIKSPIFLVAAGLVGIVVIYVGIRSPVVLIGLGVVSIAVIYIVLTRSPVIPTITIGPRCPSGVAFRCQDGTTQCGQTCSETEIWDCTSKKCICSGTNQLCVNNTQCCSPCENDACCEASNQITKNGVISCCPPGTVPTSSTPNSTPSSSSNSPPPAKDTCSVVCGSSTCKEGESCMKVTHLLLDTFNKLKSDPNTTGSGTTTDEGNWITFCYSDTGCSFSPESASPNAINNNYPYFNFDLATAGNKLNLCINNTPSTTETSCYDNASESACPTSTCKWVTLPDDYDGDGSVGKEVQNYMNYKSTIPDFPGYYCDPGELPLGKLEYRKGSDACSWQSCANEVISPGTIDMAWNDETKACTSFKVPPYQGIGSQPVKQIPCTGIGKPCSSCTSASDFVEAIQCIGVDNPCKGCAAGEYICLQDGKTCEPTSDNNAWVFNTCAPTASGGTKVQVLGPADAMGSGGNCPWGCSTADKTNCYNTGIPTGSTQVFGAPLSSTNDIVCSGNGQIIPEPKNPYYVFDKNSDRNFTCDKLSSCPSVSISCSETLCDCIFKTKTVMSTDPSTPKFAIYTIYNNTIYWLSFYPGYAVEQLHLLPDHKIAAMFALSNDAHNSMGIWCYGPPPGNSPAQPFLIIVDEGVSTPDPFCIGGTNCSASGGTATAMFMDSNANNVYYNNLITNTPYYLFCEDMQYTSGDENSGVNFKVYDASSDTLTAALNWIDGVTINSGMPFYVIPYSLLTDPNFNCTTIQS